MIAEFGFFKQIQQGPVQRRQQQIEALCGESSRAFQHFMDVRLRNPGNSSKSPLRQFTVVD